MLNSCGFFFFPTQNSKFTVSFFLLLSLLPSLISYTTGHIWACPPSEGDDYIFHCHPADQKIPKPKRLQEWYKKMLDKAVAERIVHDYKVEKLTIKFKCIGKNICSIFFHFKLF